MHCKKIVCFLLAIVLCASCFTPVFASSSAVEGVDYHVINFPTDSTDYDDFKYILVFRGTTDNYGDYFNYFISDQPLVFNGTAICAQPGSKYTFKTLLYLSDRPLSDVVPWGMPVYESGDDYCHIASYIASYHDFVASNFSVVDISWDNKVIFSSNTTWLGYQGDSSESTLDAFSSSVLFLYEFFYDVVSSIWGFVTGFSGKVTTYFSEFLSYFDDVLSYFGSDGFFSEISPFFEFLSSLWDLLPSAVTGFVSFGFFVVIFFSIFKIFF